MLSSPLSKVFGLEKEGGSPNELEIGGGLCP